MATPRRMRQINMVVFCFLEDAEDVAASLFTEFGNDDWFNAHDCPLAHIKVRVTEPTEDEDAAACDALDFDPSCDPSIPGMHTPDEGV